MARSVIRGTKWDDDLYGNSRDNTILGLDGWDALYGYGGSDVLDGGRGDDLLKGGKGRDALWGGKGVDLLDGGKGADDFWFDTRKDHDVINDFGRGADSVVIDVSSGDFEGVRKQDIYIDEGSKFDRLYVDGDYVAKVYGDYLKYSDIILWDG